MEQFVGKWVLIADSVTGFEEYAEAAKLPEAIRQQMRSEVNVTQVVSKDGDSFTVSTDFGTRVESLTFQLNKTFSHVSHGMEGQHVFKFEGGKLYGDHSVAGSQFTSVRYIQDNQLIAEYTASGKTMRSKMRKV